MNQEVPPDISYGHGMSFPDDLSDILPLHPGMAITKRFPVFWHTVFVEAMKLPDRKYRLVVYDHFEGKTRKRFAAEGLATEEQVESQWREFLGKRESIFRLERAGQPL